MELHQPKLTTLDQSLSQKTTGIRSAFVPLHEKLVEPSRKNPLDAISDQHSGGVSPFLATSTWRTSLALLFTDVSILLLVFTLSISLLDIQLVDPKQYTQLWPVLIFFVVIQWGMGLYPAIAIMPVDELRRLTQSSTLLYMIAVTVTFLLSESEFFSRSVFLVGWLSSVIFIPLGRGLVRALFARQSWWGCPVVVLGGGATGEKVIAALKKRPGLGLRPLAVLDDDPEKHGKLKAGVPVVGDLKLAPVLAAELRIPIAIVAMPGVRREVLLKILERHARSFRRLFVIPDLFGLSSLGVSVRDLGGAPGLDVQHRLLNPGIQIIKRIIDFVGAFVSAILLSPLLLGIALWIRLGSDGPVLFSQERLGHNGKRFKALKFRSMYVDAEDRLMEILEEDEDLRREYETYHKMRKDPRVTSVGKFIRKFSLDELPQIWNVLAGQMSLVGPRAYMPRELYRMDGVEQIILRVRPGITGFWQVSGRNEVSFKERLDMDTYYVRNWSIWFDVYLLACTFREVFFSKGAY